MSILITGGSGFIGGHFILDWIDQSDERIINLDKLTYSAVPKTLAKIERDPRYTFILGNIGDHELVKRLLQYYRPRAILNAAAESHVDRSINQAVDFIHTNIVGTFSLLESVRDYLNNLRSSERTAFRFIHISTDEVYGTLECGDRSFTEGDCYLPNNPYAASKASSDHLIRAWYKTYDIPTLLIHSSNNYGPHQFSEKLIPLLIANALTGKALTLYGDGSCVRDWLYVKDHCAAIRTVLEKGKVGEIYNVGTGLGRTNLEVAYRVCNILDSISNRDDNKSYIDQITFVKDRPSHDFHYSTDIGKIKSELGWHPKTTFEIGIQQTIAWYLKNPLWLARSQYNALYYQEA